MKSWQAGFVRVLGALVLSSAGWAATIEAAVGVSLSQDNITFPACAAVVDVTQPPYNAKGDGQTDDTDAIQKALSDTMGTHKILYSPDGTYLVSKTLRHTKQDSRGGEAWGFNWLQGQNTAKTIIRLKDGVFTDVGRPQPILWGGGFGSADWFHNYIQNVTFDAGRNNPGAIGLNFYSNNSGAIRDVQIISQDGGGAIGLDLGNDMNGPLLVRNVAVRGFAVGIRAANSVNSQTFRKKCDVFLEDFCGRVEPLPGQRLWARQLNTENQGTHLLNDNAMVWILGYKTERGGTLIHTKNGGKTELFGTFSYTTTAGKLAPMFVTENASIFAYFHEVCYTGDPFATLVRETRNGVTQIVERGQGGIAPYIGTAGNK
jgi:hypothetical protein